MQFRTLLAARSARRIVLATAVALVVLSPQASSAQTINFNSLSYGTACMWGGGPQIASGYNGFNWSGFNTLDLNNLFSPSSCGLLANTGYSKLNQALVGSVIGLGALPTSISRANPFTLTSFVAGAGWQDFSSLTLDYYLGGALKSTKQLTLRTNETGLTNITSAMLYSGATDSVRFTPTYNLANDTFDSYDLSCAGAAPGCVKVQYQTFFVDNIVFADALIPPPLVTPEPGTVGLVAVGLIVAGITARRRRSGGRDKSERGGSDRGAGR